MMYKAVQQKIVAIFSAMQQFVLYIYIYIYMHYTIYILILINHMIQSSARNSLLRIKGGLAYHKTVGY